MLVSTETGTHWEFPAKILRPTLRDSPGIASPLDPGLSCHPVHPRLGFHLETILDEVPSPLILDFSTVVPPDSTSLPILDSTVPALSRPPLLITTSPIGEGPTTHEQAPCVLQVGSLEPPKGISSDTLVFNSDEESPPSPEPRVPYLALPQSSFSTQDSTR